jgi:uncharacterized Tic20 family protein
LGLEHLQTIMSNLDILQKKAPEYQAEKASNSYLMSLVAIIVGLPLPIVNLIATFIFYLANRNEPFFVRWHCIQALFSQVSLVIINGVGVGWLLSIIFGNNEFNNNFFAYIIVLFIMNLIEFIATIYTAIETRKGNHVEWWFVGSLTNLVCSPRHGEIEKL